jgi:hypothetical protein
MSNPFIFDSIASQNAANTIYNQVSTTPSNTFSKYKTDRERMQALFGKRGATRTSPYSDYLYSRVYSVTSNVPSTSGPGNTGWGAELTGAGSYNPIYFRNDGTGTLKIPQYEYFGIVTNGYVYSPSNTTIQFTTSSDDGNILFFNGATVISNWGLHGASTATSAVLTLNKGYTPITFISYNWQSAYSADLGFNIGGSGFTGNGCGVFYHDNSQG